MNGHFPNLFSPIQVGQQVYANRIQISPVGGIEFTESGELDRQRMYPDFDRRAAGGAAVFLLGETSVSLTGARGGHGFYSFQDTSPERLAPFAEVADHIHQFGCKVLLELCHVGEAKVDDYSPTYGPMDTVNASGIHVHAMTEQDIADCCKDFADACWFLKLAGYDGVLIHAGHGWLFTQFLSTRTNQRTDQYGGSLENRSRFSVEVLKAIREKCGPDFNIECRISGSEHAEGGYSVEEICGYCQYIAPYCDLIHVSAGLYRDPMRTWQMSTLYQPHFCNLDIAAQIKQAVDIPVAVVGGINSPETAEDAIAQGKVDMVVLGRQLKADELWPKKAQAGKSDEIRRCLRCMRCFPGPYEEAMVELNGQFPEGCSINPYAKHPELQHSGKADVSKKVLIVGGGVAGLQAAITAAERGHQVTLVEQSSRLGGILNYAEEDEQKGDLYQFARTLECTARNRGVDLRLNTPFTPALLQQLAPDTVIAAVGSSPLVPNIPGLDGPQVQQAEDCYGATPPAGQQVVVMGGGLVGCETAVHLAQHGKQVSLVELRGEVAPDAYRLHKHQLRDLVSELVTTYLNTTCVAVEPEGVRVQIADGTQRLLPADLVVSALGRKANATAEIAAACQTQGIPCTAIGDCVAPRKIFDAVEEGFLTAFQL